MKRVILIGIVMILFISGCNNQQEIKPEELGVNTDIINNLKYKIKIDCEFVRANEHNNTMTFIGDTIEICKKVFPELWE